MIYLGKIRKWLDTWYQAGCKCWCPWLVMYVTSHSNPLLHPSRRLCFWKEHCKHISLRLIWGWLYIAGTLKLCAHTRQEGYPKVRPKCLDPPLVVGCGIGHKLMLLSYFSWTVAELTENTPQIKFSQRRFHQADVQYVTVWDFSDQIFLTVVILVQ